MDVKEFHDHHQTPSEADKIIKSEKFWHAHKRQILDKLRQKNLLALATFDRKEQGIFPKIGEFIAATETLLQTLNADHQNKLYIDFSGYKPQKIERFRLSLLTYQAPSQKRQRQMQLPTF